MDTRSESMDGRRFGIVLLGPNRTAVDQLINYCSFLNKSWKMSGPQVRPRACTSAPPSLSFPNLTGANPSCLAKSATGAMASLLVARQKDDAVAAFYDWICCERARTQVIEAFHELGTVERLRDEGGGREAIEIFGSHAKGVRRVDDRLA